MRSTASITTACKLKSPRHAYCVWFNYSFIRRSFSPLGMYVGMWVCTAFVNVVVGSASDVVQLRSLYLFFLIFHFLNNWHQNYYDDMALQIIIPCRSKRYTLFSRCLYQSICCCAHRLSLWTMSCFKFYGCFFSTVLPGCCSFFFLAVHNFIFDVVVEDTYFVNLMRKVCSYALFNFHFACFFSLILSMSMVRASFNVYFILVNIFMPIRHCARFPIHKSSLLFRLLATTQAHLLFLSHSFFFSIDVCSPQLHTYRNTAPHENQIISIWSHFFFSISLSLSHFLWLLFFPLLYHDYHHQQQQQQSFHWKPFFNLNNLSIAWVIWRKKRENEGNYDAVK